MKPIHLLAALVGLALCTLPAQAAIFSPTTAAALGMTFLHGNPESLIDGNTATHVYVNPFDPGSFLEFGLDGAYTCDFIRLHNDFGVDDDTLIEFDVDFFLGGSLVAQEIGLISPLPVTAHDIFFSEAIGPFDAFRIYPVSGQSGNRFQMREVELNGTPTPTSAGAEIPSSTWSNVKALYR